MILTAIEIDMKNHLQLKSSYILNTLKCFYEIYNSKDLLNISFFYNVITLCI